MIKEQQAREAAERLYKREFVDVCEELTQWNIDAMTCVMWINEELARREAERAERAKPIDDEWFYTVTRGRKDIGPHCRDTGDLVIRETIVKAVTTRGQLLDLLNPLKGEPA